MICDHFFMNMGDATTMPPEARQNIAPAAAAIFRPIHGTKVGCVYCGQIRAIWETGVVEVLKDGHEPIAA